MLPLPGMLCQDSLYEAEYTLAGNLSRLRCRHG
jgi:hypothetical protein